MSKFGTPAYQINTKSELIDYLGTAWTVTKSPLALMYLSRAEEISTPEELDELCNELDV